MKKILGLLMAAVLLLPGCAAMLTGMTSESYRNAPLVLAYADPDIVRDQDKVATLVMLSTYGICH